MLVYIHTCLRFVSIVVLLLSTTILLKQAFSCWVNSNLELFVVARAITIFAGLSDNQSRKSIFSGSYDDFWLLGPRFWFTPWQIGGELRTESL